MDKSTYETYEYHTTEDQSAQFLVVQDDGTFLLNRQVQYVAHVQDVKEVSPHTVYSVEVPPQQFYVDNSTELISVPVSDEFILPNGEDNMYASGYILEPAATNVTEQIKENVVEVQSKQDESVEVATSSIMLGVQDNNLTEITLTDEQYERLEQKGWILLEANNKIYVLNALGLHDITADDRLIQKLRSELENDHNIETGINDTDDIKNEDNAVEQSYPDSQEAVKFVAGDERIDDENIANVQFIINDKEDANELKILKNEEPMDVCENSDGSHEKPSILLESLPADQIATVKQEQLHDKSSIRISTKYIFKDIPEKIILGRTANGKRLVAKVVKTNRERQDVTDDVSESHEQTKETQQVSTPSNAGGISDTELIIWLQQSVRTGSQRKMKPQDVDAVKTVIAPMLKVENLKNSLIGSNLIITKVRQHKNTPDGICNTGKVTLMTGRVVDNGDSLAVFEFLPDLLHSIRTKLEELLIRLRDNEQELMEYEKELCTMYHVHIIETIGTDKVVRISMMLNKQQLPINQIFDFKRRPPNTVFACSACATLFKCEETLREHQEHCNCLNRDEKSTIDFDKADMVDAYSIINNENDFYRCQQCNAKFSKIHACVRHVKTHFGLDQNQSQTNIDKEMSTDEKDGDTKKATSKKVYKCKMCPSTYFHPATLSKHIVSRHIKVNKNKVALL